MPDNLILRTLALLLHGICNFIFLTRIMQVDLTGSWISFTGFILVALLLVYLFILHLINYFLFLKTLSK